MLNKKTHYVSIELSEYWNNETRHIHSIEEVAELAEESDETCTNSTMVSQLDSELKVTLRGNGTSHNGDANLKEKNGVSCPSTVRRCGSPPTKNKESKKYLLLRNKETEQKRQMIKEIGPNELRGFSHRRDALDQSTNIRTQETEKLLGVDFLQMKKLQAPALRKMIKLLWLLGCLCHQSKRDIQRDLAHSTCSTRQDLHVLLGTKGKKPT